MRKLSDKQKEFLLEHFFKNEKFSGWKNVATELLESGTCTVAGEERMWIGGIGNFIEIKVVENSFNCFLYKFDLESFLSSVWCRHDLNQHISALLNKKLEIEKEYKEMCDLIPQQN
jgi:hypothetical protein